MAHVPEPDAPLALAATRPGMPGDLLKPRWGNGHIGIDAPERLMTYVGLADVAACEFEAGPSGTRWTSITVTGTKKPA